MNSINLSKPVGISFRTKLISILMPSLAFLSLLLIFVKMTRADPVLEMKTPRLAVLDFRDEAKLPRFEVASLADSVRGAALNAPFIVMTKENMLALLPPDTQLEACVGECEVEVGRKLGAHYLITGQIGQIDGQFQLLLRLYETRSGSLKGQSTITASSVGIMQPKVRRAATELLTRVSPSLRSTPTESRTILFVRINPSQAVVKLDGFAIPEHRKRRVDGGFLMTIDPGSHQIQAEASGYISQSKKLKVRRGEPVEADLRLKQMGYQARCHLGNCDADLFVFTQPPGARIYLNGRDTGLVTKPSSMNPQLGSTALSIPAGTYVVTARKSPFADSSRRITIKADQLFNEFKEHPLVLQRPQGTLIIQSNPSGALVRLNGELVGKTPFSKRGLLARPYWLELILEGHQSREELITIEHGKTWKNIWKLRSSSASFQVKVSYRGQKVPKATVWLDERKLGETNEHGELKITNGESGDHLLQIRHPLYEPFSQALTLNPGEEQQVRVRLREAFGYLSIDTSELMSDLKNWQSSQQLTSSVDLAKNDSHITESTQETSIPAVIWGGVILKPPYHKVKVSAGRRWLQIRPPSHAESVFGPSSQKYSVEVGETIMIKPQWSRHSALISLKSGELKSEVYLNGERVGQTPYRAKIKTGLYALKLINSGRVPYQKNIWLTQSGYSEEIDFEKRTLLKLRCGPISGQLALDGVPIGISPQTIDVTPGNHLVSCLVRGAEVSDPVEVAPGSQINHQLTISSDLLGAAYHRRASWRQRGLITSGVGALLTIAGTITLFTTLPEALDQRDLSQKQWLNTIDLERQQTLEVRWNEADTDARNAHLLGWSLVGSGLTLTGGGLAVWWANQE